MGSNNYYAQDRNLQGKGGGERERVDSTLWSNAAHPKGGGKV